MSILTDNVDESILFLLKPKRQICYVKDNWSLRQGLEKIRHYGYTAVPVIDCNGKYRGTVTEGDFLWHMIECNECSIFEQEKHLVKDIIREDFNRPANAYSGVDEIVNKVMNQNFVPIVDDQNVLMGIITRQDVIRYLRER